MNTQLSQDEKVLLELIQAGLWQRTPEIPEGFRGWSRVFSMAKKQSVFGVVSKTILACPKILNTLPNEVRLKLKSFMVSNVLLSNQIDAELVALATAYRENGIRAVLLKGRGLAQYYPYPELRQCGDIDLYIAPEDALKAYDVLKAKASRIDDPLYVHCGKHYTAKVNEVEVEIHRHINTHAFRRYRRSFEQFSSKGLNEDLQVLRLDGAQICTPETTFNAYYIFDHLFEHFLVSGVGFRQLCDWMLFLHCNRDGIDRERLRQMLTDLNMLRPWQVFGSVLVEHFGMPAGEFPMYDPQVRQDKVMAHILEEGNFGKETQYYKSTSRSFLMKKLKSFWWHIRRGTEMVFIFPQQEVRHMVFLISNALQYIRTHYTIKKSQKNGR